MDIIWNCSARSSECRGAARRRPRVLLNNATMLKEKDGRRRAAPLRDQNLAIKCLSLIAIRVRPTKDAIRCKHAAARLSTPEKGIRNRCKTYVDKT